MRADLTFGGLGHPNQKGKGAARASLYATSVVPFLQAGILYGWIIDRKVA